MYASLDQLKRYLDVQTNDDDALLTDLLNAATAHIDAYTRRHFSPTSATHVLDEQYVLQPDRRWLLLDDDLLAITSISDESGDINVSEVRPIPSGAPYRLLEYARWDPPVTVVGDWGYSATPPADIVYACMRLAAYWYRAKDAQVFDVTMVSDQGALTIPRGIPADVKAVLDRYARRV